MDPGIVPGERSQGGKEPVSGVHAVHGETDLGFAARHQGSSPLFETAESAQERLEVDEERAASFGQPSPSAFHLEEAMPS